MAALEAIAREAIAQIIEGEFVGVPNARRDSLRAAERIVRMLDGAMPKVPDETLAADVAAGLSLRECAKRHGVGVGRIRGAVARAAHPHQEKQDG